MAISNTYCESCSHATVCEWSVKLYKLEGNDKKPGILDIEVQGCEQYLSLNSEESEE